MHTSMYSSQLRSMYDRGHPKFSLVIRQRRRAFIKDSDVGPYIKYLPCLLTRLSICVRSSWDDVCSSNGGCLEERDQSSLPLRCCPFGSHRYVHPGYMDIRPGWLHRSRNNTSEAGRARSGHWRLILIGSRRRAAGGQRTGDWETRGPGSGKLSSAEVLNSYRTHQAGRDR